MCEYYYDDERAIAYKVYPVITSMVKDENTGEDKAIIVHTNIKMTNFRKEKARRPVSEVYPVTSYNHDSAKSAFFAMLRGKLLRGAKQISEQEYDRIKARVEI